MLFRSEGRRNVLKSRVPQKSRVPRLGCIPWILRDFCVAKRGRKTADLCDEFRDKGTETPARTRVSAEGSVKWPLMTRLLGLPQILVAIALAALALGYLQARRRWASYREQAAFHRQEERLWSEKSAEVEQTIAAFLATHEAATVGWEKVYAAKMRDRAAYHARMTRDFERRW